MDSKHDDVMVTDEAAMRDATLGYDRVAILRDQFDKYINRAATMISFEDFHDAVRLGAAQITRADRSLGVLTEDEFRQLAKVSVLKANALGWNNKAEREIRRIESHNAALFDEVCHRLNATERDHELGLVLSTEDAALYVLGSQ